jgi:hypothetical protein
MVLINFNKKVQRYIKLSKISSVYHTAAGDILAFLTTALFLHYHKLCAAV